MQCRRATSRGSMRQFVSSCVPCFRSARDMPRSALPSPENPCSEHRERMTRTRCHQATVPRETWGFRLIQRGVRRLKVITRATRDSTGICKWAFSAAIGRTSSNALTGRCTFGYSCSLLTAILFAVRDGEPGRAGRTQRIPLDAAHRSPANVANCSESGWKGIFKGLRHRLRTRCGLISS